ncbi:MAG: zf-HC2 domain-containing protein [Phycisphaerales bacterium]|nr:zf-HC2 domain-containing protein [Phycisphaerales bacterium]
MTCREFLDYIGAYLSGELSEAECRELRVHLDVCSQCVDYLDSYQQTIRLSKIACCADSDPVPGDVPEDLVKAVLAAMKQRPIERA